MKQPFQFPNANSADETIHDYLELVLTAVNGIHSADYAKQRVLRVPYLSFAVNH